MIQYAHKLWSQASRMWPGLEQVKFTCLQGPVGYTRYEWGVRDGEPVITHVLISIHSNCSKSEVRRVIAYEVATVLKIHPSAVEATLEGVV